MTIFVGIDIAKHIHYASIVDKDGCISKPFKFENNFKGFNILISRLNDFNKEDILIGYESTAHYQDNLDYFLRNAGYKTVLINPLQTSSMRKSMIRNTKTDSVDSRLICDVMITHRFEPNDRDRFLYADLRRLCDFYSDITKKRTTCKIQLVSLFDRLFPELAAFFNNNLHLNTVYTLIKNDLANPYKIRKTRIDKLANLLENASRGRFKLDKATALKKLASESIGIDSKMSELQAKQLVQQIELFDEQLSQIKDEIASIDEVSNSLLMSIPGMKEFSAACIMSTIKNIHDFDSPDKVLAYAGLDPIKRQSGHFDAKSTRMSKRGNRMLRYHLIWAAWNVVRSTNTFKEYYDKKRAENKSHYNALGHCAKKLVRSIFYMYKHNQPFNLE